MFPDTGIINQNLEIEHLNCIITLTKQVNTNHKLSICKVLINPGFPDGKPQTLSTSNCNVESHDKNIIQSFIEFTLPLAYQRYHIVHL